jgi:demethylmenaquinone methyltransferase/2-methoxy-6-polyprenyl-1,4-benzoquinol methylase
MEPGRLEPAQVRAMFDRIAGVYDAMNSAMTAGLHHRWRARAADLARVGPGSRVLDVATGTGDLALELAARVQPGGEVVGSDFAEAMLARARTKAQARFAGSGSAGGHGSDNGSHNGSGVGLHPGAPRFEWADALSLPYADASFDAATVGFGARNFDDLGRGLREMARVVRPGGRVVVLEITTPTRGPLAAFYALWFDRFVPALGRALGRGQSLRRRDADGVSLSDAYSYLPSSVRRFPAPDALAHELADAGLGEISYVLTAGGIIAIHAGTVPGRGGRA